MSRVQVLAAGTFEGVLSLFPVRFGIASLVGESNAANVGDGSRNTDDETEIGMGRRNGYEKARGALAPCESSCRGMFEGVLSLSSVCFGFASGLGWGMLKSSATTAK